jgi:hypothetical protein
MQTTDVRDAAQSAVDQSKTFLSRQVDERSTVIGQQIETIAGELRHVGEQLGQTGVAGPFAGYVNQGADLVEKFSSYLKDADSERLIGDLEAIARRRPWAVAGAALVLGFGASRFLKTTSARRYRANESAASAPRQGAYGGDATSYGEASYGYERSSLRGGSERYAT